MLFKRVTPRYSGKTPLTSPTTHDMFRFLTSIITVFVCFGVVAASSPTSAQAPETLPDPAPTGFNMFVGKPINVLSR